MKFDIIRNDITNMKVDAIVLPANTKLREGSGVSKRIFEKAGRKDLEKACKKIGKAEIGTAVPTVGFNLEADYIIHAVVPKWIDGKHQEYQYLSAAYLSALSLSNEIGCSSLAFPLLAAGNQGFDEELAFEIAQKSIEMYQPDYRLETVHLVVYNKEVMTMLRNKNIYVETYIDEKYILLNDESYQPPAQRALEQGKYKTKEIFGNGIKMVKNQVSSPEKRKKMIEGAAFIAKFAVDKNSNGKSKEILALAAKVVELVVK